MLRGTHLLEYTDIYSKKSGMLWQYYRDGPALNDNNILLILLSIKIIVICSNLNSK